MMLKEKGGFLMLKVKAFGVAFGIMWAITVGWTFLLGFIGKAYLPFNLINELYLNLLSLTPVGCVFGVVLAFVDAFIAGAIFVWIYNALAK